MAQDYGTRPSNFLGFTDGLVAYQFDLAINVYGHWSQNKLDEREETKDAKGGVKLKPRWQAQTVFSGNLKTETNTFEALKQAVEQMELE